jgi:hypothetical protein
VPLDDARAVAEATRQRRAALLAAVASGELTVAGLDDDPRSSEVKAVVIVEAVPGVGKVRARRSLDALGVPAAALWGDLSNDQRRRLAEALRADGARPEGGP